MNSKKTTYECADCKKVVCDRCSNFRPRNPRNMSEKWVPICNNCLHK